MLVSAAMHARDTFRRVARSLLFDRLVSRIRNSGEMSDTNRIFNYAARGNFGIVSPIQSREELVPVLDVIARQRPKVVMEIGTANGGTLLMLTRVAAPDATIISLDLPGGPGGGGYGEDRIPLYEAFALPKQDMHLIRDDSHDPAQLERLRALLGGRTIDLLFIDGDHTYEGVKMDYEMYSPLVTPGGIVCFHDIAFTEGVTRLWDELKSEPGAREFVASRPPVFGIGMIRVPEGA